MRATGIRLGPSNAQMARFDPAEVAYLVPDSANGNDFTTPLTVSISELGCLVGRPAEIQLTADSTANVAQAFVHALGNGEPCYWDHLGRGWLPESLCALVIKKLTGDAVAATGSSPTKSVLCVPAFSSDRARQAVKSIAYLSENAGITLVEEPVAIVTYASQGAKKHGNYLTLHIGSAYSEAAVLTVNSQGVTVMGTSASMKVHGGAMDTVIRKQIEDNLWPCLDEPSATVTRYDRDLQRFAEAQRILFDDLSVTYTKQLVLVHNKVASVVLTRSEFEKLILQHYDVAVEMCSKCLNVSGVNWSELDSICLSGGATRSPVLRRLLADKATEASLNHYGTAAVFGAAQLALENAGGTMQRTQVQAVATNTLGIRVNDPSTGAQIVSPWISQGASLPAVHKKTLYTQRDDQKRLILELVQIGTDGTERPVGHFSLGPLSVPRKNLAIEVVLTIDEEGLTTIGATDPVSGERMEEALIDRGSRIDTLREQKQMVQEQAINE